MAWTAYGLWDRRSLVSMKRAAALAMSVLIAGCGSDSSTEGPPTAATFKATDPGPVHVHGLGVNPADGALFIATHTGLFRVPADEKVATRVAGRYQDTMGFTVLGPDLFLGSGHPDLRTDQPPYLGLIESQNAGDSWKPISLYGKADFHVLESRRQRVVGYGSDFESRKAQLLVSDNSGKSWTERRAPMPLIDLAVSPADPDLWVASGVRKLAVTADAGRSWRSLPWSGGLLAWRKADELYRADGDGGVSVSSDFGKTFKGLGKVGGQPAAFEAETDRLYVALHDGVIRMSPDGRDWTERSRPQAVTTTG